jgi:hypothetical protein
MTSRPFLTWIVTVALELALVGVSAGQSTFFDEGNQRYQAGDYEGALENYALIADSGFESGQLYYILYYERARRLLPGDDDVRANLALARSLTIDDILPLPGFWLFRLARWWLELVPATALAWLVGVAYVIAMTTAAFAVLRPSASVVVWCRRIAITSGAVTLVFGVNLTIRELGIGIVDEAVVMAGEAAVHSAPSDDSALTIFAVHEGTTVRIDRQSAAWVEIVLEDGKVGWIQAIQLERI